MGGQLAAPVTAPKLNSITYNRFSITARWTGNASANSYYLLALYENGTQYKTQQVVGSSGALLNLTLDPQKTYTVMVAQTDFSYGSVGPYSNEITVIQAIPTGIQVTYNGSDIHARWDRPEESLSIEGGLISLFKTDGSQLLVSETVIGNLATLTPSPPLSDITGYFVTAAYSAPGSTGPGSDPIPIIQQTVCLSRLTYNGDSILATTEHSLSSPNKIGLFLYIDGQPAYSATGAGNLVTLPLDKPLQPWQHAYVQVAVIQDHTCGPLSQPVPVLTGNLCLQSVSYDGNAISASWSGATPNFEYTGATMLLFQAETLVTNNSVIGLQGTLTLSAALDPAKQYSLRVAPTFGPSRGINSDAIPVVSSSGTFTRASYQDGVVKASWTTGGTAGLTGCRFTLLDGNELIASVPAGMSGGAIDHDLSPGTNYRVALRQMAGISLGPPSYAPVLATAALINEVITESDKITVIIAGTTGAQAFLYKGDTLQAGPVTASGTPLKVEFPFEVVPYYEYKICVQAVQGSALGPISAPVHVISGVPNILATAYNGDDVKLSWEPMLNEPVTGYEVYLLDLDHGTSNTAYTKDDFIIVQVPPEGRHALQVKAIGAAASGILSPAVNVIKEKARVPSLAYDGTYLHASWTASAITEAVYQISIIDDNDFTMLFDVAGHETVLPVSLNPSINYTVKVRVVADNATGPWGPGIPVLSALPLVTSTTADHTKVTLLIDDASFTTKPGVTGCQAYLTRDDGVVWGPVMAAGTPLQAEFPVNVLPYHTYTAMVQAVGPAGTGPLTNGVPVLSAVPVIKSLDYDGTMVYAVWRPVSAPVTGYTLTLASDSGSSVTVSSERPYASVPLNMQTASGTYTVYVQAIHGIASGPKSDGKNPVKPGLYYSTEAANAPALKPANSMLPVQPFETRCLLPELYQTPPALLPSVGPFALKSLTGAGNMKYYLAFTPSNPVWKFDAAPFRSSIAVDYVNFLTALEGKLKEQDPQTIGVLLPGAVQDVMQAIAGCIPQTFIESLYYSHGFSATWRYVDLRPGMRLQVEYESWQYISAQAPTYSNGYSFNGTIQYDISRFMTASGEHSTVLNVFLSSLEGLAIPAPTGSGPGPIDGGGGGIDTLFTGFAQPFLRIFYPTSFKKPCEVGSTYPRDNVMILAAASWSTLNNITDKITQGLAIPAFGTDYALFYLRGRNTLTPLIKVSVNGYPTWLPVGTTLAQALSQHGVSPCAIPVVISELSIFRNWNGACGNAPAGLTTFVPHYKIPIRINWGPSVLYANGVGWLDLPLIHGDEIQIMGDHL